MTGRFTPYVPDELVPIVGSDAALMSARLQAFMQMSQDGVARLPMQSLCGFWNWNEQKVRRVLKTLCDNGIIERDVRHGRGDVCAYKKGIKNDTFYMDKKVSNLIIKGIKNDTFSNIDIKNRNKKNKGAHARACNAPAPQDMKDFLKTFWAAYGAPVQYDHEKEGCACLWALMHPRLQADVLQYLRTHKRPTKNPLFFLKYYKSSNPAFAPIGTILTRDEYYRHYGHDLPTDGYKFEKPDGYDVFVFVKREPAQ